jgi:hypothetical protein
MRTVCCRLAWLFAKTLAASHIRHTSHTVLHEIETRNGFLVFKVLHKQQAQDVVAYEKRAST